MTYRKSDEFVVNSAEEDDGPYHHTTDEAEGPTRSQEGVHLWDKHWAQCPRPAARRCQPAHVHTLQRTTYSALPNTGICLFYVILNKLFPHDESNLFYQLQTFFSAFLPEAWVQEFWNTVCRTSRCRLGIPPQWGCQRWCTGPGGWREYTDTRFVQRDSLLDLKSCWRLSRL